MSLPPSWIRIGRPNRSLNGVSGCGWDLRSEIRVECDVTPRHLTIRECRPPWWEHVGGSDWTRFPIARLHYSKTTGLWTLYWRDRNLKYHRYQPVEPSAQIQDLLDYLDSGADPIFWG